MLRAQLDHIVGQVLDFAPETSDIFVVAGKPLQAEVHGVLQDVPLAPALGPLAPFQTESMALCMMDRTPRLYADLVRRGSCDLSYSLPGRARFRVNIFSQRGSLSIVLRQLSMQVPSPARLGLPAVFEEMAREKFGLILVTGATGSGKSTSLAALVDSINEQFPVHILTLEDPVEYVHEHKRGTVNQRELGQDFDSFASGLRAALRQAPKVILVGEIRDRETMEIAMQAAETGHLVLGTLHTADTGQTVNRVIGMFDLNEESLMRQRLSETLKFVVSQRLPPRVGGGRVAAFEIMRNTLRVRELILNGESGEKTFYNVVEQGDAYGMATFDQCLAGLFRDGLVSEETAMTYASDRSNLMQRLDRIKTVRGDQVSEITGLEIDLEYGA
ncbi:PilT/PilU family type 4a pilus ATPase [Desulfocurvus sp.]|jgi:twitching motility protein PilT|uniref:type IV pilus twitching motility protein PilT n=1 Tax=Desulfocurvus sp. TaxID=2871698 RepID=UPI0025C1B808|nr:PilT/PilU family type 4a pilus ATPase [Desulfocurvus sp.]MCK9239241.1 PilT/PilU family type 4a pilus ATPase [Desulfocurvus sp.]